MGKLTTGEIRLRRAIIRGKQGIALELRTPSDPEWGLSIFCPVSKDEHYNVAVSLSLVDEITRCLDLGYVMKPCYKDNVW